MAEVLYKDKTTGKWVNLKGKFKAKTTAEYVASRNDRLSPSERKAQKELLELQRKGISTEGIVYDESGKGYSASITEVEKQQKASALKVGTYVDKQGRGYSYADSAIDSLKNSKTYQGGQPDNKTKFRKISSKIIGGAKGAYEDTNAAISDLYTSTVRVPVTRYNLNKDSQKSISENSKILLDVKVPGSKAYTRTLSGAENYIAERPLDIMATYYGGRTFGAASNLKLAGTTVSNTFVGRSVSAGLLVGTGVGIAAEIKAASTEKRVPETIGKNLVSFTSFGLGAGSTTKKDSFKNGLTILADTKRMTGKTFDRFNPFYLKSETMDIFEPGRGKVTVDIVNIPGIGPVFFKPIPSQRAGFRQLKGYSSKEQILITATPHNPYRGNWRSLFGIKKSYTVEVKPGAGSGRAQVGGIERGQFFSLPDLQTGKGQAYTYYLGEGATLKDVSSGVAKFTLFPNRRVLIEKTFVSKYEPSTFAAMKKGALNPSNPRQLKILKNFAKIEDVPGTTKPGFAGGFGYRTELEAISTGGTIKTKLPGTLREKLFKFFGRESYYMRTSQGTRVEIGFQKQEPFVMRDFKNSEMPLERSMPKKDVAQFKVSSYSSIYSPYKDLGRSSLGLLKTRSNFAGYSNPTPSYRFGSSSYSPQSGVSGMSKTSYSPSSFKSSFNSFKSFKSYSRIGSSNSGFGSSSFFSGSSTRITNIPLKLPKIATKESYKTTKIPMRFKESYAPSVEAAFWNIRAKSTNKRLGGTGLTIRPILA